MSPNMDKNYDEDCKSLGLTPPTPVQDLELLAELAGLMAGDSPGEQEVADATRRLRALVTSMKAMTDALREVERHHVARNAQVGRPEERSHTLAVVRGALAINPCP